MLFADDEWTKLIQAIQAVALAAIAGWVAIRTRDINARVRQTELRTNRQQQHIDALAEDVVQIQANSGILSRAPGGKKPPGGKPSS